MNRKMYFNPREPERCFPLDAHIEQMKTNSLDSLILIEAKIEYGTGFFFCKDYQEVFEVGCCGTKKCDQYRPINGQNGKCWDRGYVYEQTENKIKLSIIDGKIKKAMI